MKGSATRIAPVIRPWAVCTRTFCCSVILDRSTAAVLSSNSARLPPVSRCTRMADIKKCKSCRGKRLSMPCIASRNGKPVIHLVRTMLKFGTQWVRNLFSNGDQGTRQRVSRPKRSSNQVDGIGKKHIETAKPLRALIHDPTKGRQPEYQPRDPTHESGRNPPVTNDRSNQHQACRIEEETTDGPSDPRLLEHQLQMQSDFVLAKVSVYPPNSTKGNVALRFLSARPHLESLGDLSR